MIGQTEKLKLLRSNTKGHRGLAGAISDQLTIQETACMALVWNCEVCIIILLARDCISRGGA